MGLMATKRKRCIMAPTLRLRMMYNYHMKFRQLAMATLIISLAACTTAQALEKTPVPGTATAGIHAASPAAVRATAAPPTVTLPRPTASPTPVLYTVQEGDTLFVIALDYGVTIEAIAAANYIDNPELIHPGQVLVIPVGSLAQKAAPKPASGTAAPGAYVVQSGDSLFTIALEFGVTVESIVVANQIKNPEFIRPGQVLVIPTELLTRPKLAATQSPKPGPAASPPPRPQGQVAVNGVALSAFVVMPPEVQQNVRDIYRKGQTLGRNPHAFARVGDSTVENGFFLMAFDQSHYNLGNYAYLQATIDHFSGSFARQSVAVGRGFHTTTVMDPAQTNPACVAGETLVECELRLTNPSVVVIRLGANDVGMPDIFARKMRQMVELALSRGVIPVLGTKADRQDPDNAINTIIHQVASDYKIPLWDFDVVAQTMPNRGLASDNVHPTIGLGRDYSQPETFQYGHAMQDLTALMALDAIWREANPTKQ
jgi:LysM repeat protein